MLNLIKAEPVMSQAVIQSALGVLLSFGIHLTADQMGAILVLTASILGLWTRQQVTAHPNNPAMNPPKP